jgi:hypothetical protein
VLVLGGRQCVCARIEVRILEAPQTNIRKVLAKGDPGYRRQQGRERKTWAMSCMCVKIWRYLLDLVETIGDRSEGLSAASSTPLILYPRLCPAQHVPTRRSSLSAFHET